jgi:hypothetical protein
MLAGTLKETQAELARLQKLAATLASGDAAAAAAKPAAGDAGGRLLTLILRWLEMRHGAVEREVAVLEQREQHLKAGQLPTAADALSAWLAENGVQVITACLHPVSACLVNMQSTSCLAAAHVADPKRDGFAMIQHLLSVGVCLLQVHKALQIKQTGSSHSLVATGNIAAGQHLAVIPLTTAVPIYTGDLLV